ncbi:energy transducer TonB [Janthinobacterium sp. 17J80-10]|uniref:energy transducer TonB n=1 Tax=Janthinobacterium sp. 17J80-10 TaxID=2497863 RepID=UPI0010052FB8|nr:energy transducer TonB [Janthinobacterium sp. 17J80-10]QAU35659.1 energy transducer TonB [Janthinobacterium sp. 17J80-10]
MTTNGQRQNWQFFRQAGPLGLVILLHAAFFYALQSGLGQQPPRPEPREIIATLIAAQPAQAPVVQAPQPPQPKPEPPKPQVKPKAAKPAPTPPVPVAKTAPSPQPTPKSITAPAEPASAAPAEATAATAAPASAASATASAGPAAPAAPVQPRTVTTGVEYLQPPRPEYPALSRRMGEEGTVMLRILITDRGRAERADIHKSSGVPRLDEAARQAALRAVFKPYTENGRPVPVYAILPISFQLDN